VNSPGKRAARFDPRPSGKSWSTANPQHLKVKSQASKTPQRAILGLGTGKVPPLERAAGSGFHSLSHKWGTWEIPSLRMPRASLESESGGLKEKHQASKICNKITL